MRCCSSLHGSDGADGHLIAVGDPLTFTAPIGTSSTLPHETEHEDLSDRGGFAFHGRGPSQDTDATWFERRRMKREELIDLLDPPGEWLRKVFYLHESRWDYKDQVKPFPQRTIAQRWVLRLLYTALRAGATPETDKDTGWPVFYERRLHDWIARNWERVGGNPAAYAVRTRSDGSRWFPKRVGNQMASAWERGTLGQGTHVWITPCGDLIFAYGDGVKSQVLATEMRR